MEQPNCWIVALSIPLIGLFFTFFFYRLKTGVRLRASYSVVESSISCDDAYVGSIVLENMKDRAITIFGIYLKVGNNYYIEVENFENSPLVLKAFETYHKEYDPIAFYNVSTKRLLINDLIKDKKVKKQIVLSTSSGKYRVPSRLPRWNPITEFFQNYMTAVVHPIRSTYKEQSYGSNVKYLVEFKLNSDKEEIVPIHPRDDELKKFRSFKLTKESIQSKTALEDFLRSQQDQGKLSVKSFTVHDLDKWRGEMYEIDKMGTIRATYYNKFQYYVLGWISTKIHDWKLRRENRKRQRGKTPPA